MLLRNFLKWFLFIPWLLTATVAIVLWIPSLGHSMVIFRWYQRLVERLGYEPKEIEVKPFYGAFKDKELKEYKDKYCGLCEHKGLIAHIEKNNPLPGILPEASEYISAYWCPNCNTALQPSQTSGEPSP